MIGAVIVLTSTAAAQGAMAKPVHGGIVSVACKTAALISAISGASSGEKLQLASSCTYRLTAALPDIHTGLTIAGSGATLERSEADGTPDFTILTVDAGDVNLVDVNFRNGGGSNDGYYLYTGAIDNEGGNITVLGGTFTGNNGGAFTNGSGTLTVTSASFMQNAAGAGGAITNDATMTLRSSHFSGNSARSGGAIDNAGIATVIGTTFTDDGALAGGALYNDGRAALSSVTIQDNSAGVAPGGGIFNDGTLTVASSNIVHNYSHYGGGIYNAGSVALSRTKVSGNTLDNCAPVGTIAGCSG